MIEKHFQLKFQKWIEKKLKLKVKFKDLNLN
jgi:hypothetical protein